MLDSTQRYESAAAVALRYMIYGPHTGEFFSFEPALLMEYPSGGATTGAVFQRVFGSSSPNSTVRNGFYRAGLTSATPYQGLAPRGRYDRALIPRPNGAGAMSGATLASGSGLYITGSQVCLLAWSGAKARGGTLPVFTSQDSTPSNAISVSWSGSQIITTFSGASGAATATWMLPPWVDDGQLHSFVLQISIGTTAGDSANKLIVDGQPVRPAAFAGQSSVTSTYAPTWYVWADRDPSNAGTGNPSGAESGYIVSGFAAVYGNSTTVTPVGRLIGAGFHLLAARQTALTPRKFAALVPYTAVAADAFAVASASADLTTGIQLAGSPAATAAATAALDTTIRLAASAAALPTATAALTTNIRLVAAAQGVATATGELSSPAALVATAVGVSTATAGLTTSIRLVAAAVASAFGTGQLATGIPLAASAAGQSSATASLTVPVMLYANARAQATASARLTVIQATTLFCKVGFLPAAPRTAGFAQPSGRRAAFGAPTKVARMATTVARKAGT